MNYGKRHGACPYLILLYHIILFLTTIHKLRGGVKQTYSEPKANEFIVMTRYNNMIENIVEEYLLNKIKTM